MIREYASEVIVAVCVAGLVAVGLVAYKAARDAGARAERLVCDAKWGPKVDRLKDEKLQAQQAAIAAQQARAAAEASLAAQLEEQANEHSKREAALRAGRDGLQRELGRLRDALATAAIDRRELAAASGSRSPLDGGAAGAAGQLLGECAAQLAEVGGRADSLVAQVVGLQAYARLAQRACGS